jgi:signal transduction histidine kinase
MSFIAVKRDRKMPNILITSANQKTINEKILDDRVRILHSHLLKITIPALLLCATVIFGGIYNTENKIILISWYTATILISVIRIFLLKWYEHDPARHLFHLKLFVMGAVASAFIWGLAGTVLISSQDILHQVLIIIIIAGLGSGGSQTLQASKMANYSFMVISILPLGIWLLFHNEYVYMYLSLAVIVYLVYMLALAKKNYDSLINSLQLRYENELLLKQVLLTNAQLKQSNLDLNNEIVAHKNAQNQLAKSEKSLTIRHEVSNILFEHISLNEAVSKVIEIICKTMQLEVGVFWEVDNIKNELHCMYIWNKENDAELQQFAALSKQRKIAKSNELPYQIYETKKANLVENISLADTSPGVVMARSAGLQSNFALPIMFKQEVIGVIEFYSRSANDHNEIDMRTLGDIGNQTSTFVEREEAQKKFESLLRRAGITDVATSILHNVGNVLNSVKVTIGLLNEKFDNKQDIKNLSATALMISENLNNISSYFLDDPKGKLIPSYLLGLAKKLENKNSELKENVAWLSENVTHIEDVVKMQKAVSGITCVPEKLFLPEVINTAIQMSNNSLSRNDILIEKKFNENIFLFTDKSKLLQILLNLIKNAKDALSSLKYDIPGKKISIAIENLSTTDPINIIVSDNGIGIPEENLTKLFSSGYTTKPDGHGFGLHSSALSAQELGGSLTVKSEGLGRGATFTLTLPIMSNDTSSNKRGLDVKSG